ncbi:MAG: TlyA family RNA methyltransferase [Alphaproteobacteria bacterium]|nr:TlyA family RNA methyltransferase [Alphaproteobacteria bacterium]
MAAVDKRIDIRLVEAGLFASRAKAREAIEAGLVTCNGRTVSKPSLAVGDSDELAASAPYPWVSRGGVKLAAALEAFKVNPAGFACLDAGASTGGFSDVLLTHAAAKIYCVDVGQSQLHARIASDARVTAMEKCDLRHLRAAMLDPLPSLAVCDVSFISLKLVLPSIFACLTPHAQIIALIKPQFEAGRENVVKGLVRDERVHQKVCDEIAAFFTAHGWRVEGLMRSPVTGGDGNVEFLIFCVRNDDGQ